MTKKKAASVGQSIGGILVGFDQQIFRTTPPVNELVAKGDPLAPVAASGGGTMRVGMPGDPTRSDPPSSPPEGTPDVMRLSAPGVEAVVDLAQGGRLASLIVGGRELLKTSGYGLVGWGSFPMAPYAGRVRNASFVFNGQPHSLAANLAPHAIHGTVFERRWHLAGDGAIAIELGPAWPFAGGVVQRFELGDDHLAFRMELHADAPMPASIGWHPWFRRHLDDVAGALVLDLDAGSMYRRDDAGIATRERVPPEPGPWDDCFTDLHSPPRLTWPDFLELTIESDCPDWVVYTVPDDALCVEPQTAPPDALNMDPTVVLPGRPLVAHMTWRWRSLEG